jgi:very-long-chain enoyl-CoA reductase
MGWLLFSIVTQVWAAYVFWALGSAIMCQWAIAKHRRYKKDFKDYPKNRKAMFPCII